MNELEILNKVFLTALIFIESSKIIFVTFELNKD